MSAPKVGVVLTSFNAEKYLPKALDSLLSQTLNEIEIICVDDGSADGSLEILKEFAARDKRVRVFETKKTEASSPSAARNFGLTKVSAPYVMFCDGDDFAESTMTEKMYAAITESGADLAVSELRVIYEAHREMKVSDDYYYSLKYNGTRTVTSDIVMNVDSAPTNKIFRKSLLDQFGIEFPEGLYYEDAYFCSAYFCVSKKVRFVNEQLYNYVRHMNSIMSKTWSKNSEADFAVDHLTVAERLFDFLEKNGLIEQHNDLFWQLFASYARFAIVNSKSRRRRAEVRDEALDFVKKHKESFDKTAVGTQEEVKRFCSGKANFNTVNLKKAMLKVMPTYRLATENINRLRTLKNQQAQIREKLNRYTTKRS